LNKQNAKVNIYNAIGQLVSKHEIDVVDQRKNVFVVESSLQQGMYVVVLLQGALHQTTKLIVE
jgi:hypothetical protein